MAAVKIVPREGSRKIGTNIIKKYYDSLAHVAREEPSTEEKFTDERWTGTIQKFVPVFYGGQTRMYPFVDPTDPNLMRPLLDPVKQKSGFDKLNEMVKRLRLRDDDGKTIEQVDIFNQDDPFLTHDDVFIKLNGGVGNFDDKNLIQNILLLHLRATEEFAVGPEKDHPPMNLKVKYVIVDNDLQERLELERRANSRKVVYALDSLKKLSDKVKIGLMLNLIDKHTVNKESTLDSLLENYAMDNKTIAYNNVTKQQHFLQVLEKDQAILDAHYLFALASDKGFIKYNNLHYMAFGEVIGGTRLTAVENLSLVQYKHIYDRLAESCKLAVEVQMADSKSADIKESLSQHKKILSETFSDLVIKEDEDNVDETNVNNKDNDNKKNK